MRGEPGIAASPNSAEELGLGLRALRSLSLRRLAAQQQAGPGSIVLSKTQLARYESGAVLPPLSYATHLDNLYQGEGWVEMSIRTLWRPTWNPWRHEHGAARQFHACRWPAPYGGLVWIKFKPLPENVDEVHSISLEWGPWGRQVSCSLGAAGVVLATGKAADIDGISRTCNITCEPASFALFGAGEGLEGEQVIDIHRGWEKVNPSAGESESDTGPARA